MSNLLIRTARDSDRDAMLTVTLSAYMEYALVMQHWEGYRESIVTTLGEVPITECIVAEQDGVIVGSVLLYPAGSVFHLPDDSSITIEWPEIRLLAVVPVARGRGIGEALVEECMRRARQAGAPVLTLHTTDIMQTAKRMYLRMGFVHAPELDFIPAPGVVIEGFRFGLDGA